MPSKHSILCIVIGICSIRTLAQLAVETGQPRQQRAPLGDAAPLQLFPSNLVKRAPPFGNWFRGESSHARGESSGAAGSEQQGEQPGSPPMSDSSGEEPPTPPSPPSDLDQYLWSDRHRFPPVFPIFPHSFTPEEFKKHQAERKEELERLHQEDKRRKAQWKSLSRYQKRKYRRAARKAKQEEEEERARYPSEAYYYDFYSTLQQASLSGTRRGRELADSLRMMIRIPDLLPHREGVTDEDARQFLQQYERGKCPTISDRLPGWVGVLQSRYQRHINKLRHLEHRREREIANYGEAVNDEVYVLMMQEARGAVQQFRYLQHNFQSQYAMAQRVANGEYISDDE